MYKKHILNWASLIIIIAIMIAFIDNMVWKGKDINLSSDYNELFSKEQMEEKGHVSELPEYATDVSIAYQNRDGTKTLYVYSSPIRFLDANDKFSLIDTRIKNIQDKTEYEDKYAYTVANNDIESFFPKSLNANCGIIVKKQNLYEFGICDDNNSMAVYTKGRNFINEQKNYVKYKGYLEGALNLIAYPSSLGVNCEMQFVKNIVDNKVQFWIKPSEKDVTLKKEPGGYVVLKQQKINESNEVNDEIIGVIQTPLLKLQDGSIIYSNSIDFTLKSDGSYVLNVEFAESVELENTRAFISFEMRREKQPDNTIYSKLPNLRNSYLCNYAVVGNSTEFGTGKHLIRYKFVKYFNLQSSQVKRANYRIYSLNRHRGTLETKTILEDWCSLTGNWNEGYEYGPQVAKTSSAKHEFVFDITDELKKWCDDLTGQKEHNGLVLSTEFEQEGVYSVILSNDNTLYSNVTEVILK